MKKLFLAIALVFAGTVTTLAQCDKTVTFKSVLTNYVNDKGEVERSNDEETIIKLSKTDVSITPGDHTLEGKVSNYVCNWTVPFKDGKTTFSSVLTSGERELHANVVIEGKGGVVTLTFTADEMPGKKIQVTAVSFE